MRFGVFAVAVAALAAAAVGTGARGSPPATNGCAVGLALAAQPSVVAYGGAVTVIARVTTGEVAVDGVRLTLSLSRGLSVVAAPPVCAGTRPLVCTLGGFAPGSTADIPVALRMNAAGRQTVVARVCTASGATATVTGRSAPFRRPMTRRSP